MTVLGDLLRGLTPSESEIPAPKASGLAEKLRSGGGSSSLINWSPHAAPTASWDLERILGLPERPIPTAPELAALVEEWTARLKRPAGTMKLKEVQAWALAEAARVLGLLGAIGVGEGKTLICLLLPTVLQSKRAVLLIPPQLRDQVICRAIPELAQHWRIPNLTAGQGSVAYPDVDGVLHVIAYSELSAAGTADCLERIQPDLVICDEAHAVRNFSASRTKRFNRYFKAHPTAKLCALSGTIVSKSIRDFGHLAKFALRERSPVPLEWPVLQSWAEALDPSDFTPPPGELERLCRPGEDVRGAFKRRLLCAEGVVSTSESKVGCSLVFYRREVKVPPEVRAALDGLRNTWCTPGGEEITDALSFSRYARQLGAGLFLRWIWPRNESLAVRGSWLEARKSWHREVRERLKLSLPGQDSPLLLARAAAEGRWNSYAWEDWAAIKDHARPETEAVWISDYLVEDAVRWGKERVGVIWYEHEALGEAIARKGGFPLYGGGDEASRCILNEDGSRTIVASRKAHGEGKNLQAFCRHLFTTMSSNAAVNEQLLGRSHRTGQKADEVEIYLYLQTPEMRAAFMAARKEAKFIEEVKGEKQRLSYATLAFLEAA